MWAPSFGQKLAWLLMLWRAGKSPSGGPIIVFGFSVSQFELLILMLPHVLIVTPLSHPFCNGFLHIIHVMILFKSFLHLIHCQRIDKEVWGSQHVSRWVHKTWYVSILVSVIGYIIT